MKFLLLYLFPLLGYFAFTSAQIHGFIGYGKSMFEPPCAFSCQAVLLASRLNCSIPMNITNMAVGSLVLSMTYVTTLDCYATDDAYLQSAAFCVKTNCPNLKVSEIENIWPTLTVGTLSPRPDPKESYQDALNKITSPPNQTLIYGGPLNQTSIIPDIIYQLNYRTLANFNTMEVNNSTYGLILLITGFGIPILLSLLRFIPFPRFLIQFWNSRLNYPPLFGRRHATPYDAGYMPTRGQALFILYIIILNIVLSSVGYNSVQPNVFFLDKSSEITKYVAKRFGILAFANIPLLILYSSRNSLLLWVTNWSFQTFLLIHRWVAYITILQSAIHSAIYLRIYIKQGFYSIEITQPYWIWGIVAVLAMSFILPLSILPVRKRFYETFLASHVILSVFILVGCYLHIWYCYQHQWGYEIWIIIAFAVWGFDRVFRILKFVRNGIKTAKIIKLDDEYFKVIIKGVSANGHAFLYFPTLTWRVWENHPFSVTSNFLINSDNFISEKNTTSIEEDFGKKPDLSILEHKVSVSPVSLPVRLENGNTNTNSYSIGLTFYMRKRSGLTSLLLNRSSLPVLVETSYGIIKPFDKFPTLICICGGVGITGVINHLRSHLGQVKLYWSLRNEILVKEMQENLIGIEKQVKINSRFNMRDIIHEEISNGEGNLAILACGPPSMVDDIRMAVCELGSKRLNGIVKLEQDSYHW